ncbi:protein kinase domain-containing protein [Actinorugispora endophytica]|uniref:non-specific serine/threonine protein kinase n=1 Tax=Actinorugispora endophytica TaxID=1605990 RepID=A0A4R6UAL0_9ACTN|nr:protein kinase [Actinorugispora endophytica]TDQ43648.1 serine/threonine protein kinase [Actinorugispora endophytica]
MGDYPPTDSARLIADRYELRGRLGQGGMGAVWRAWDRKLRRVVAVKEILLPDQMGERERAERHARVLREARAAARISHPGVVTIHDLVDSGDHPWVVMDHVPGESLRERMASRGTIPVGLALDLADTLLAALGVAHEAGVIHRDIKPGNIMLGHDDQAVLTDFGIATISEATVVTETGGLLGSLEYMAPERLADEDDTPASDLWSLGVTLYAALEGRSPFHRKNSSSVLHALVNAPVPAPRNAGPLAPVISGLLRRDVNGRMGVEEARSLVERARAGRGASVAGAPTPTGDAVPAEPDTARREIMELRAEAERNIRQMRDATERDCQRVLANAERQAREQAGRIVADAEAEADRITGEARREVEALTRRYDDVRSRLQQLRGVLGGGGTPA